MHTKSVTLILVINLSSLLVYGGSESSVMKISAHWFTNTAMEQLKVIQKSGDDVPEVPGMNGIGIRPDKPFVLKGIEVPGQNGYISFWISTQWYGVDQQTHRLLNFWDGLKRIFARKIQSNLVHLLSNEFYFGQVLKY